MRAIEIVVRYILNATDAVPPDRLGAWMATTVSKQAREVTVSTAEKLRQEGRKEERASILLRLLELRFGPPPEGVVKRVRAADPDTLLKWSDRVLTASTVDEVLAEPS